MTTLPEYNEDNNTWRITVENDIQSIFTIFTDTKLSYPYKITLPKETQYCNSFKDVLLALEDNWESFDITGYEEYYSPSEINLITAVKKHYRQLYKFN